MIRVTVMVCRRMSNLGSYKNTTLLCQKWQISY